MERELRSKCVGCFPELGDDGMPPRPRGPRGMRSAMTRIMLEVAGSVLPASDPVERMLCDGRRLPASRCHKGFAL